MIKPFGGPMEFKLKILRKGDTVLNVVNYADSLAVCVKRKQGNVDVLLIGRNEDGIPLISGTISICEGDNEIEMSGRDIKYTTF